jgi:hypothetical protein
MLVRRIGREFLTRRVPVKRKNDVVGGFSDDASIIGLHSTLLGWEHSQQTSLTGGAAHDLMHIREIAGTEWTGGGLTARRLMFNASQAERRRHTLQRHPRVDFHAENGTNITQPTRDLPY